MEPRDTRIRPKKRTVPLMGNTHEPLEEIQRAGRAQEDAYFRKRDQELLVALRDTSAAASEQVMRHATSLRCPQCGEPYMETPLQRVRIDACPGCGGIWRDKGGGAVRVEPQEDGWLQRLFAGLIASPHARFAWHGPAVADWGRPMEKVNVDMRQYVTDDTGTAYAFRQSIERCAALY